MLPSAGVALGGVGWLESRDDDKSFTQQNNFNGSGNGGGFGGPNNNNGNNRTTAQQDFFFELTFSPARSIRTSIIILASFNIIAAFATALGILCDGYFRKRRNDKTYRFWRNGFSFVPEADVYPLVLSVGIFIQGFTFAGAQSTGLDTFFGRGCTWLAQLLLPSLFVAPYIQLVFGVEIATRAIRKKPFEPRRKYNVSICLTLVGMLLLTNFLIATFDQAPGFCFASLVWFISHYSEICFGLLIAIITILMICLVTVFVRLHRSIRVEVTARVAASRMVYYLALAIISDAFMVPFFFVESFTDTRNPKSNAPTLAMVASVVSTVSGLMTGGLYLFLKSSTLSTIGPRDKVGEYENRRARYKDARDESDDSDDDDLANHVLNPVQGPRGLYRTDSEASLIGNEKEEEAMDEKSIKPASIRSGRRSRESARSKRFVSTMASALMPKAPEPARSPFASMGGHARKRSYSLFPRGTGASKSSVVLLPATTYSPADALKPPPSMANLAKMRHRRDSSLVSSATVQIGIRLSSVDDMPPSAQKKAASNDNVVHTLDCPIVAKDLEMQSPKRAGAVGASPTAPDPLTDAAQAHPERDPVKHSKMKTLPPVPKIDSQVPKAEPASDDFTLSPTVYSPATPTSKTKLPSPKGVGITAPPPKPNSASPARSPPRRRGGAEETAPLPADAKGDWI